MKIKEFCARPLSEADRLSQIAQVAERYNWETIAAKTLQVYAKVMQS